MVGIGDLLGAEFLAATGGTLTGFASADHLAGYAGLAPAPRDSGKRTGNLHRPRRYNRRLQRVFYTSAMISIQRSPSIESLLRPQTCGGKATTTKPSSHSRGAGSTSYGRCSRNNGPTRNGQPPRPEPLDKQIRESGALDMIACSRCSQYIVTLGDSFPEAQTKRHARPVA